MFQTNTRGVINMPKNQRVLSQNIRGIVGKCADKARVSSMTLVGSRYLSAQFVLRTTTIIVA